MCNEKPKHELLAKSNPIASEGFGVENLFGRNGFSSTSSSKLADSYSFKECKLFPSTALFMGGNYLMTLEFLL